MSIQYAVVRRGTMWCVFQAGQQLQVFAVKQDAIVSARTMAESMRNVAPVDVLIQSENGELRRDLREAFRRSRRPTGGGLSLPA